VAPAVGLEPTTKRLTAAGLEADSEHECGPSCRLNQSRSQSPSWPWRTPLVGARELAPTLSNCPCGSAPVTSVRNGTQRRPSGEDSASPVCGQPGCHRRTSRPMTLAGDGRHAETLARRWSSRTGSTPRRRVRRPWRRCSRRPTASATDVRNRRSEATRTATEWSGRED